MTDDFGKRSAASKRGSINRRVALTYGIPPGALKAGAEVLYEGVAEAHEEQWLDIVARIYLAVRRGIPAPGGRR